MSGSIWADEDYNTPEPEPEPEPDTLKIKSDAIESARPAFAQEANRLKQELMKLLSMITEPGCLESHEIIKAATEVCNGVFTLSQNITNETERDLYVICDLLAISLAATYAEKQSRSAVVGSTVPYLSKAFSACKSTR